MFRKNPLGQKVRAQPKVALIWIKPLHARGDDECIQERTKSEKETAEDYIFYKVVLTCEPPKSLIKLLKLKNIYCYKTQ